MVLKQKEMDFCNDFSSSFFENLFNSIDSLVIVLDQTKKVLFFNKKTENIFGEEQHLTTILNQHLDSILENKTTSFSLYNNILIVIKWNVLTFTQPNQSVLSVLVGKDQTELNHLKEQNFALNFIIKKVPGYVFWKNRDLQLIGCNENFARQIGLSSPDEVKGKTDLELPWELSETEGFIRDDLEIINTGRSKINFIERQRQKDGKQFTLLTSKVPTFDTVGQVTGILGIYMDITELKNKEEELERAKQRAEEANRSKTNFLAVISHELRTPLNGVFGMAQILHEKLQDHLQISYVKGIEQSALHLLALVNDILDFSSVETGKISIQEVPFNLYETANSCLSEIKFNLQEKPIRLIYQYDPEVPHWIVGDGVRIKQLILNLISNAIKFTAQGTIKVLISCLEKNEENVRLKIGVKDTGIGISKAMQQKIFERFVQVESEYSRPFAGVGLGLAICKQLVESMGGSIQVESDEGQGSFFWLEISFKLPSKKQMAQIQHDLENKPIRDRFDAYILLVEDNVLNQKVAKNMLEDMGCSVDVAASGMEAIHLVEKNKYDVVFMDVGLPGIDGLTTTDTIRKKFQNNELPIIGLTAHALETDIQRCYQATMNDVLTKPISINILKRMLSKWIKSSN